jgi:hypothetical protein
VEIGLLNGIEDPRFMANRKALLGIALADAAREDEAVPLLEAEARRADGLLRARALFTLAKLHARRAGLHERAMSEADEAVAILVADGGRAAEKGLAEVRQWLSSRPR